MGWPQWKVAGVKERNVHLSCNKFHKLSLAKKLIAQFLKKPLLFIGFSELEILAKSVIFFFRDKELNVKEQLIKAEQLIFYPLCKFKPCLAPYDYMMQETKQPVVKFFIWNCFNFMRYYMIIHLCLFQCNNNTNNTHANISFVNVMCEQ